MNNTITKTQYNDEIKAIAESLVNDYFDHTQEDINTMLEEGTLADTFRDECNDKGWIHEVVESHEWIIYTYYHKQILNVSDNYDAIHDTYNNEELGAIVAEKGIEGLELACAYWAMYTDVQNAINELDNDDVYGLIEGA